MRDLRIFDCLGEAWEYFTRHPGLAIGGLLLYFVITLVGQFIPLLNFFFAILVVPPLVGGLMYFFLNLARDKDPKIEDLFAGFSRYGATMGIYWLAALVFFIGCLPSVIYMFVSIFQASDRYGGRYANDFPTELIGGYVILLINVIIVLVLLIRFWAVWYIIMDEPKIGVFDALRKSAAMTRGNSHNIILLGIVNAVICLVATLLLFLPLLLAAPVTSMAMARAYVKLGDWYREDQPALDTGPPAGPPLGTPPTGPPPGTPPAGPPPGTSPSGPPPQTSPPPPPTE